MDLDHMAVTGYGLVLGAPDPIQELCVADCCWVVLGEIWLRNIREPNHA